MSQENVEIVRRGYKAFNRGDLEAVVGSSTLRWSSRRVSCRSRVVTTITVTLASATGGET
jgi:hypothetical protein